MTDSGIRQYKSEIETQEGSSTTTTAHAAARALAEAYVQNIGDFDMKARWIMEKYGQTMDYEVILHAIEATGWAPRPSKQYLAAILRRYEAAGIRTMADVLRDEDQFERLRASDLRRRHAKWYGDDSALTDFDVLRDMPF